MNLCPQALFPNLQYNIGNSNPENLLDFVKILCEELVRVGIVSKDFDFDAHMELVPMQPGDVPVTFADTSALEEDFGFKPSTTLRSGLRKFAEWYKDGLVTIKELYGSYTSSLFTNQTAKRCSQKRQIQTIWRTFTSIWIRH